jgi:hypothetical protein
MPHPLVTQLRFTRGEWSRGLEGLTDADARRRFGAMNCISWNIGHLAWQEQRYWLWDGAGPLPLPRIDELFAYGAPTCTPPLDEVLDAWRQITTAADRWLDTLTTADLVARRVIGAGDRQREVTIGNLMQRVIYHYWYHLGENLAIRQLLGHTDLPQFVGALDRDAPYQPH